MEFLSSFKDFKAHWDGFWSKCLNPMAPHPDYQRQIDFVPNKTHLIDQLHYNKPGAVTYLENQLFWTGTVREHSSRNQRKAKPPHPGEVGVPDPEFQPTGQEQLGKTAKQTFVSV